MSRTDQTKQIHEKRMFKSSEKKYTQLFLQYPQIYPTSTNFSCLSQHRTLLPTWKYSYVCVVYIVHRGRKTSLYLQYWCTSENCWFTFSKSCYIWNIGQKTAHILETLPKEETKIPRKLNSVWSKINDCLSWMRLVSSFYTIHSDTEKNNMPQHDWCR